MLGIRLRFWLLSLALLGGLLRVGLPGPSDAPAPAPPLPATTSAPHAGPGLEPEISVATLPSEAPAGIPSEAPAAAVPPAREWTRAAAEAPAGGPSTDAGGGPPGVAELRENAALAILEEEARGGGLDRNETSLVRGPVRIEPAPAGAAAPRLIAGPRIGVVGRPEDVALPWRWREATTPPRKVR